MEEQQTDINSISEVFPKADFSLRSLSQEKHQFRPSLFKHQALMDVLESADTIDQESIINMMNRIRFMDGHILTQFDHSKFEESILIKAYPINQSGTELTCRLSKQSISGLDLGNYHFRKGCHSDQHILDSNSRKSLLGHSNLPHGYHNWIYGMENQFDYSTHDRTCNK